MGQFDCWGVKAGPISGDRPTTARYRSLYDTKDRSASSLERILHNRLASLIGDDEGCVGDEQVPIGLAGRHLSTGQLPLLSTPNLRRSRLENTCCKQSRTYCV